MTCIDGEVTHRHGVRAALRLRRRARRVERRRARRSGRRGRRRGPAPADQRHGASVSATAARGTMHLREDETGFCAITWGEGELGGPRSAPEALERLDSTEEFWRSWLRDGDFPDHPWRVHLQRSALVLKGLTYTPTGAIVAAPTTSLPETPGGERNWDYRYCWIRDSTFSLWALHTLGFDQEARDFMRFILDVCREDPNLQIMYGIGGEKQLDEKTLDHLGGYGGARPVRIGNGAYDQRQHDVWGALLDSIYLHEKALKGSGDPGRPRADQSAGRGGDRRLAQARPGHLGVPRRAQALRLLEADDLGRGRPRRATGALGRPRRARRRVAADRRGDPRRDPRARLPRRGLPPALRHRRARRVDAADPAGPLPAPRRPPRAQDGRGDRRRPDRARPRPPLQGRGDRRRAERRGGDLPDLLVLAGLGALGDRRAAAGPRALRAAAGGRRLARPLRRGAGPARAGATWATSRRRSPTWR